MAREVRTERWIFFIQSLQASPVSTDMQPISKECLHSGMFLDPPLPPLSMMR